MNTVEVIFKWGENDVQYYRTKPNNQLICIVDDVWYSCTDDDTWNEPGFPIDMKKYNIIIVE